MLARSFLFGIGLLVVFLGLVSGYYRSIEEVAGKAVNSLMGTLRGFPNLPAKLRGQQSCPAPHAGPRHGLLPQLGTRRGHGGARRGTGVVVLGELPEVMT